MPCKSRCSFITFMPNKPDKYGIKFWVIVDVNSKYVSNIIPYLGAQEKDERGGVPLAESVVMKFAQHVTGKGYNITCDNFFTSLQLAKRLANEKISIVGTSPVALQLRPPPKVSARAPAHRSYHFRGVKLKSCIKKIHHNLYISKQANVRIKHADTEGASHKKFGTDARFSRTFMQTLRNESNDTEKHEKVIKTHYHLNSLERIFLFANAVMTLS